MATIEDIPNEVLEEILLYLPGETIPNLMFISKQFRDVISSSVNLMDSFEVYWTKNKELDMRPLLESVRKYRKLQISKATGLKSNLLRFITSHKSTLTSIFLFECTMTTSQLQQIFSLVAASLKDLSMCEINIEKDQQLASCKWPCLKSIELMYGRGDGFVSMLEIFSDAQIEQFQYEDDFEMDFYDIKKFAGFLAKQSKLKTLTLTSNVAQQLFNDRYFTSAVEFNAEQIFLWLNPANMNENDTSEKVIVNLTEFLESQRDTLKVLTLGRCLIGYEMISRLLKLQIKDFRVVQCHFVWNQVLRIANQTVEKIFISMPIQHDIYSERALCDFMRNCINVKSMKIACAEVTFDMSMVMAYNLKQLKKINFFQCDLLPITYPLLNHLQALSCHFKEVVQFIRVNRQLTALKVPDSYSTIDNFQEALDETSITLVRYD